MLQYLLEVSQPCDALLPLQHPKSFATLDVPQMISVEIQIAFFPAPLALVAGRVARAEASASACHAKRITRLPCSAFQQFVVEADGCEIFFAHVAAPGLRFALALDALFRFAQEALWGLLDVAHAARVATTASEKSISCVTCRCLPLRYWIFVLPESFAAY